MSPTIFWPGRLAAGSRRARSGIIADQAVPPGQRVSPRPGPTGLQPRLAHQPADQLGRAAPAAAQQRTVQPPVPVFAVFNSNNSFTLIFSGSLLWAISDFGLDF
jgi:hypothetical protein